MIVLVDTDTDQMPELGPQRIWEGGIANHIERWQDWSYDQQWFEVCLIFDFFCIRGGHLTGSADLPTPIPTRCPNSGSGKVVLRITLSCDRIEDNHQWFEVCLIFDFSSKGWSPYRIRWPAMPGLRDMDDMSSGGVRSDSGHQCLLGAHHLLDLIFKLTDMVPDWNTDHESSD